MQGLVDRYEEVLELEDVPLQLPGPAPHSGVSRRPRGHELLAPAAARPLPHALSQALVEERVVHKHASRQPPPVRGAKYSAWLRKWAVVEEEG